jgi:heme-degrading monooxygenase HmoA
MFARLLSIKVKTERIDEAAMLFEESVIPLCRNQKGFQGAYYLAERETGQCLLITLWKSKEDMTATEESRFFQEQLVKFMDFFKEPPIREVYEVIVKE